MIQINLLPSEARVKPKGKGANLDVLLQARYLPRVAAAVLAVLLSLHLLLGLIFAVRGNQLRVLSGKWQRLSSERKAVEEFSRAHAILSEDANIIQALIAKRLNWSEKLNRLSLDLPSGVWFSEVTFTGSAFNLKGSAVSLQKEEVSLVKNLIDNLRKDAAFFKDFLTLELGSLQKKSLSGFEVTEFVLGGTLNIK